MVESFSPRHRLIGRCILVCCLLIAMMKKAESLFLKNNQPITTRLPRTINNKHQSYSLLFLSSSSSPSSTSSTLSDAATSSPSFGLTPTLQSYVDRLRSVMDDKLRYQQLLFLATKLPEFPSALKTEANKVPGCLSTVHVHATMQADRTISFQGDSDAQLTKGLVALLVMGLSGNTIEDIQKVRLLYVIMC